MYATFYGTRSVYDIILDTNAVLIGGHKVGYMTYKTSHAQVQNRLPACGWNSPALIVQFERLYNERLYDKMTCITKGQLCPGFIVNGALCDL